MLEYGYYNMDCIQGMKDFPDGYFDLAIKGQSTNWKTIKRKERKESMGEVQLWLDEGLGADKETLERVLHVFRNDGVQGIESQQALNRYIHKLDDKCIQEMNWIDAEATLQMLVDCYGVTVAFQKYVKAEGFIKQEKVDSLGWISPAAYAEVVKKYGERTKKLEDERDTLLSRYEDAIQKIETAEKQRAELQNTLAHYKADLYDFYAQAGRVPNYK